MAARPAQAISATDDAPARLMTRSASAITSAIFSKKVFVSTLFHALYKKHLGLSFALL